MARSKLGVLLMGSPRSYFVYAHLPPEGGCRVYASQTLLRTARIVRSR
jgi:hypothetical protein